MKKKLFALILIAALVFTGGLAALSVLPHTHGKDFDHSKHSTCPVYQVSLTGFAATAVVFAFFSIYLFSKRFFYFQASLLEFVSSYRVLLRGPPAL